jgi:hypothetical protein
MAPVTVHLVLQRAGKLALVDQTIAVSVDLIEGGSRLGVDPSSSLVALAAQFQEQTVFLAAEIAVPIGVMHAEGARLGMRGRYTARAEGGETQQNPP